MGNTQTPASSFVDIPTRLAPEIEQWRRLLWDHDCMFRVAIPAEVVSFDPSTATVTVQPLIREKVNKDLVPTDVPLPQLSKVPVLVPSAGDFLLTFPISPGDECLLVFSDTCINAWWQNGGLQNREKRRRHDLSDGLAIFGPFSLPNVPTNWSSSSAQLRSRDGQTVVEVGNGEIQLTAPTVTVNGNLVVTGTTNLQGTATIQNKAFLTHEHTGVQTGGGHTGGVL